MTPHNSKDNFLRNSSKRSFWLTFLNLAALSLLAVTCAKVITPPGGPEDKTPPSVLTAEPHSHQTNVPPGNSFKVVFSENINPLTITKQFFVSPRQIKPPKIKIKGAELEVVFADSFSLDQTYVITIGSGLRDMHGNQLGSSQSFAFTRGAEIDTSHIAGVVTDADSPVSGVGVALYRKFTPSVIGDMDSLFPDYYTVSGVDGGFELAFLPVDSYFILAFRDSDKNQLFQYGVEDFGVTTKSLEIGSAGYENLELRMQQQDTAEITIVTATFNSDGFLRVNLSRALSPDRFFGKMNHVRILNSTDSSFVISPTVSRNSLGEPTKRHEFLFEVFPAGDYLLSIDFGALFSDGRVSSEQVVLLNHSDVADSHPPAVKSRFSQTKITPWETIKWHYSFTEPIVLDSSNVTTESNNEEDSSIVESIVELPVISIKNGRQKDIKYELRLSESRSDLTISSPARPVHGERYFVYMNPNNVSDGNGNVLFDSLVIDSMDVWLNDSLGTLKMTIENRVDSAYEDKYYLRLSRLKGRDYWISSIGTDTIRIELPAGDYIIEALLDTSKVSSGSLYPLKFASPRSFYPDTVHIRPRFDTEGVRVIIE